MPIAWVLASPTNRYRKVKPAWSAGERLVTIADRILMITTPLLLPVQAQEEGERVSLPPEDTASLIGHHRGVME